MRSYVTVANRIRFAQSRHSVRTVEMHGIGDEGRLHDDERDDNRDDARAVEELEPRAGHPYAQAFVERVGQRFGREAGKEECQRRLARSS